MRALFFLPLFFGLVHAEDLCRQPAPEEMARAAGVALPPLPWHVANVWWNFEKPVEQFTSLEVDVTIDRDVPEDYNLYIAPCGIAKINGLQFYGGIQTNINGWADKESRERVHRGKGGIFSRWSSDKKTPIGLEHVRTAAAECLVESAGYEGEFASVRRPFAWTKGTYTWCVTKGVSDGGSTWFTCRIRDAKGVVHEVGSLRFEGTDFTFWERHSAFVEVYSTATIPRSGIPRVKVSFGWPRLNGQKVPLKKVSAYYPDKGGPDSPDCAWVKAEGETCVVEVGPIFKREEAKRRHDLVLAGMPMAPVETTGTLLLCGMDEVFLIDAAAAEKGSFEKLWSWSAKDRNDLPEALRGRFATTDDCKPVDGGKKVLISSSSGGCALIDHPSGRVLWHGLVTNAHSLDLLPRERIVVASSVAKTGNRLVVFDLAKSSEPLFDTPLPSAHGVVWDGARRCLWALGFAELRRYELKDWDSDKPALVQQASHPLPDEDGHDLQAVPGSSDLVVTTGRSVYLFDRDKPGFRPHPQLGGKERVKGVSIHPVTGRTVFIQASDEAWWSGEIGFLAPAAEIEAGGERLYKARWLPPSPAGLP